MKKAKAKKKVEKKIKKKLPLKTKVYIWVGVALLLSAGLISLIIIPYQNKIAGLKMNILENRQRIEETQQQREALISSGRSYGDLKDSGTEKIFDIYINREQILSFIDTLEELAINYDITQQINISDESLAEESEALFADLIIYGDFIETMRYLNALEQQNIYLNYQNITISEKLTQGLPGVETSTPATSVVTNIEISINWLQENEN